MLNVTVLILTVAFERTKTHRGSGASKPWDGACGLRRGNPRANDFHRQAENSVVPEDLVVLSPVNQMNDVVDALSLATD